MVAFIIICVAAIISALAALTRQFQMLQQNSYYPSRYFKWVKDSFFEAIIVLTLFFCAISVLYTVNAYISAAVAALYMVWQVLSAVKNYKKSIKKLVFTARIIRLILAAALVLALVLVLTLTAEDLTQGITFCVLLFLCIFTPVLTLVAYLITKPIELAFSKYYINDAKNIIKGAKNLKVIGVTGSYGKTGTKFILARLLSEKFNVLATPQSYNTTMGVVRTIREKLRPQTQVFVCEMGAKNIGDIKEICDIVKPQMSIITSVGPQHLETFKSIDNVFKTKFELYDACRRKGGDVFVNVDSPALSERLGERECITYGTENAEFTARDITYSPEGASFRIVGDYNDIPVTTRLLGRHNVLNITGAAAVALKMGLTKEDIQFAVSRLEPTEHRLELKKFLHGSLCLDDAYNANPEGCIEAVQVLSSFEGMKKVIITPGLVELGDKEYDFNYKLGLAAAKTSDIIILVGHRRAVPMSDAIATTDFDSSNLFVVGSFKEALEVYTTICDENTVVLIENDLPDNYLN